MRDQWDLGNDIHIDTLDVFFLEVLESDFNFEYEEDDSEVTHFGMLIKDLYKMSMNQEFDAVRQLIATVDSHPTIIAQTAESDDDDSDGSSEEEEVTVEPKAPKKPVADADGWFTAPTRGRGKPKASESNDSMNID